jgi:hypothetical protein
MAAWLDAAMHDPHRFEPEWFDTSISTVDERAALEVFGRWVYAARRAIGCSQATFGGLVGVHQSTISRLERGQLRHLVFATAVRLLTLILECLVVPRPPNVPRMPPMSWRW